MTSAAFRKLQGLLPPGADIHENPPRHKVQNAKSERHQAAALVEATKRKAPSMERIKVRFTGYRVQLLDADNFAGSCKDLLDGVRLAGLIYDDTVSAIIFETEQVRVRHRAEERTEITIEIPK